MDHHGGSPTWIVRLAPVGPGVRLAVKDCIDVAGLPTTVGCPVIAERARPAGQDAAVVAAARRSGAQIVGKTNLAELCWSAVGTNAWSGMPVNPADPRRLPGGSSSGSAVAVAAGEADVALGTDTGGSVRIPAACCGVVGLKTTWGRVPVQGVYPLAPSLDTVGPLGTDVAAAELGMRLIEPGFAAGSCELRVARVRPETDPEVDAAVEAAIDAALAAAGIAATEVAGLDFAAANAAGSVLIDVEAYRVNQCPPWPCPSPAAPPVCPPPCSSSARPAARSSSSPSPAGSRPPSPPELPTSAAMNSVPPERPSRWSGRHGGTAGPHGPGALTSWPRP